MTGFNGIERERKVYAARITGAINNPEISALLQKLGTAKAAINLARRSASESGQARSALLLSRICSILGINTQRFTEELLIKRFREWSIPNLDKERNPDSLDYSVRHLLEQVFECALAYKTGDGLTIVSKEERKLIIQGKLPGFQLLSLNPQQPASITFLSVTAPPGSERALVRYVSSQITEIKAAYPEQLRQRILFYLKEGHLKSAALLLFREQKVKDILAFLRKEKVAEVIKPDELRSMLSLSINKKDSTTVEEMILGLLLRQVHPIVSAHFIADLAKIKFKSAVKVLGMVGQTSQAVEVLEIGDLRAVENLSLAGFVLSTMLMQGNEKIANLLVAKGIDSAVYGGVFERVLNELHLHFDESVCKADEYRSGKRDSLYYAGVSPFQKAASNGFWRKLGIGLGIISVEKPKVSSSTAMIKAKKVTYGFGGAELFTPRLYFRNLARKLCEAKDFDTAWELMTCGRSAVEAFEDLNQVLDFKSFALLLRSRDRKEVVEFVTEVLRQNEIFKEALAYILRGLHDDVRDIAGFFEYMIEKELEIPGSREAAYSILFYGATALEREGMEPLVERYAEILVQIEQDKAKEGWFNADVFIRQGRFLITDAPSKVRKEQINFYFQISYDKKQSREDRIYALKMLARMGAWDTLIDLWGLDIRPEIGPENAKRYNEFVMHQVKTFLDIMEEVDVKDPKQLRYYLGPRDVLLKFRERLIDLFSSGGEVAYKILVGRDEIERGRDRKERTLQRAKVGREKEVKSLLRMAHDAVWQIKGEKNEVVSKQIGVLAGIVETLAELGFFEEAVPVAEELSRLSKVWMDLAFGKIAAALARAGEFEKARLLVNRIRVVKFKALALVSIATQSADPVLFNEAFNEIEKYYKRRSEVIERNWNRETMKNLTTKAYMREDYLRKNGESGLAEVIKMLADAGIEKDKKIELLDMVWNKVNQFQMSEEEKFEIRSKLIAIYSRTGKSAEETIRLINNATHMLTTESIMWLRRNKGEILESELLAALTSFVEMVAEIKIESDIRVEYFKWAMGFVWNLHDADGYVSTLLRIAELIPLTGLQREQMSALYDSIIWLVRELDNHIKRGCWSNQNWPGAGPQTLSISVYGHGYEYYKLFGLSKIMVSMLKAGLVIDDILKQLNDCVEGLKAKDHFMQHQALQILAVAMGEIGNFEKAIGLAAEIKGSITKSKALIGILDYLVKAKIEKKKKTEYLIKIKDLALKIDEKDVEYSIINEEDKGYRDNMLGALVLTMTHLNLIALDLVEKEIKDAKKKSAAYADIAIGFAKDGEMDRASHAFQKIRIKDQEELNRAFVEIQAAMVRYGYIDEAKVATMMETTPEMQARECPQLAALIHKYTNPQSEGLSEEEKLRAWVHTRIYAVLGMGSD